jgi:transposase
MSSAKLAFLRSTLNQLNTLLVEFEKSRNLDGILKIIAIRAVASGSSIEEAADLIHSSSESVRIWISNLLLNGPSFLVRQPSPGRPKTLSDSEVKILKKIIAKPPRTFGLRGGCWNSNKIKKVIQDQFGKILATKYIPEFLRSIGLSFKKARVDCGEKNEVLRSKWIERTWPKILETADKQDAHIFFGDEAYFSIFGTSSYSWSLTGVETVVESTGSKENVHIIGAINFSTGKTHALVLEKGRIDADVYICFLKTLLKETRKPIHLIVDNAGYHKAKKVREFTALHADRLTVHYLPPYSPDYNPIEGLWKKLKQTTTHNVYFESIESLWAALTKGLQEFRKFPDQIRALCGFYLNLA